MIPVYLDNNSTTQPAESVIDVVREALAEHWANPSSVHRAGQRVRQRIELAREEVASLIGCRPREITFTSGGTESTNLAIRGLCRRFARPVVVTDRLEHSATRETVESLEQEGAAVAWLDVNPDGRIDVESVERTLAQHQGGMSAVSIQWANNETGVIQQVQEIGSICRGQGVPLHCDGTQWVGKMPTNVSEMPIDLMTFSAHKFHGPKGIGALFVRSGMRVPAQITGGPQEREHRGGTENVPGILGMGEAARLARIWLETDERERLAADRDRFESSIVDSVEDASVNGGGAPRLWNTSNIGFARLEAEAILLLLSEKGVYASAGAACSSGSLDPSPVLLAMGVPPVIAHGSIRFSLSRDTTGAELDHAAETIGDVMMRLRRSMV